LALFPSSAIGIAMRNDVGTLVMMLCFARKRPVTVDVDVTCLAFAGPVKT